MSEKKKLLNSVYLPLLFIIIIWFIKIGEYLSNTSYSSFGLKPRDVFGLLGIVFSPFLHGSFEHLWANTLPFFILSVGIFYFYKGIALNVIGLMWFLTGLSVWIMGRNSYHIGASGLIYAFTSFLFFSGILRKYLPLIAISLLVIFLYGGLVWGILPMDPKISWESHLMGFISGIITAVYYKKQGPQRKKYDWELEDNEEISTQNTTSLQELDINYILKKKED